ncbi:MAG: (d)CMP kinase [Pseudomonadota bacterium]
MSEESAATLPPELTPVIAVDGPSGSGKGTLARLIAEHFGWHLLDSGALYRIIGCVADKLGLDSADAIGLATMAGGLQISFADEQVRVSHADRQWVLTDEIRTEEAGVQASVVAALPEVRTAVLALLHSFRQAPGLVADGRDMGTVVFPDAQLKIFLDASAEERAQRRYKQLKNKGLSVSLRGLLEQIRERDARDRGRAVAPLKPAADALVIDSTNMTIEAVLQQVLAEAGQLGIS